MHAQRVGSAWCGQLAHLVVVWMKRQRDERLEATGLVLQRARTHHVIDPLLHRLDVPVEHRDVGLESELMRETMNREIPIGVSLVVADLLADAFSEDLRPTTRQ